MQILPHQQQCLDRLTQVRNQGQDRALVVMASGLGKTYTAAFDAKRHIHSEQGKGVVLFLCHQNDILHQAKETFQAVFGEFYNFGFFNGQAKTHRAVDGVFASFQTMRNMPDYFKADHFSFIVVDESHHSMAETYLPTLGHFKPKFLLGVTATPDRADLKDIRHIYGDEVFSLPLDEALAKGLLTPVDYRLMSDEIQNLSVLQTVAGKLSIKQLNRTLFIPKRDEEIARLMRKHITEIDHPRVMVFCSSVRYCERFAHILGDAVPIHSQLSHKLQRERLGSFRAGEINTILTVDKFNEGIDVPEANLLVFLRSTASPTIFFQQLGRGLRLFPGKKQVRVLDFAANCQRLEMLYKFWQAVKQKRGADPSVRLVSPEEPIIFDMPEVRFNETIVQVVEVLTAIRLGYTRESLVKQLQHLAVSLGRTPSVHDVVTAAKLGQCANPTTFQNYFGSWNEALVTAGLVVKTGAFTDHELSSGLKRLYDSLGRLPTQTDLNKAAKKGLCGSYDAYHDHFGGLKQAYEAAGIKEKSTAKPKARREVLISQLQQAAQQLGRPPRRRDYSRLLKTNPEFYSTAVFSREFSSWDDALEAAGFEGGAFGRKALLKYLVALSGKLGRTPRIKDALAETASVGTPSAVLIIKRFGTWNKALVEAGLKPNLRHQ